MSSLQRKMDRKCQSRKKGNQQKKSWLVDELFTEAVGYHQTGRLREAEQLYNQILVHNPQHADSLHLLGVMARQIGRPHDAVNLISKAIAVGSVSATYQCNLGNAFADMGQLDEAIAAWDQAIAINPDYLEVYNQRGIALKNIGNFDEAEASYHEALKIDPLCAETHGNLAILLKQQGRWEEAIARSRTCADLQPTLAEVHYNLGTILGERGQHDEAIACFRKAIDLKPAMAEAHLNLAMSLLTLGLMPEGWREYEWRWHVAHMRPERRDFVSPQWKGEAVAGATLLIHSEQGLGDTIQFCRYASVAERLGLYVIMEAQEPLIHLLRNLKGVNRLITRGEPLPVVDFHCPMQSLPLALGTTLDTIPAEIPYLSADNELRAIWRIRLGQETSWRLKIGVAWAGRSSASFDNHRSIDPHLLKILFDLSHACFFNLQKEGAEKSLSIVNLMDKVKNFADTAALIANLDLIISVDTAVAHLAAAMGKPVWLLDRFDHDWRWLEGRRDSPWYPSLRIYRQPRLGDWETVLAEVRRDLDDEIRRSLNSGRS